MELLCLATSDLFKKIAAGWIAQRRLTDVQSLAAKTSLP
jgi:hypothetical protein